MPIAKWYVAQLNTPTALCRFVRPPPNECPVYDTTLFDREAEVMLELWGMRSTSSLPLHLGPLWPGVVTPDRVLYMDQIELLDF